MEDGFLHLVTALQMLDDDAFQQLGGDCTVPDSFRIDDDNRAAFADAEARSFSALHAIGSEQQTLALKQRCEQRVQRPPAPVRRAVSAGAHDNMSRVRFHRAR